MRLNAEGKKPEKITSDTVVDVTGDEPTYVNVIGEDSITRFDKAKRNKKRKNKNNKGGDQRAKEQQPKSEKAEKGEKIEGVEKATKADKPQQQAGGDKPKGENRPQQGDRHRNNRGGRHGNNRGGRNNNNRHNREGGSGNEGAPKGGAPKQQE